MDIEYPQEGPGSRHLRQLIRREVADTAIGENYLFLPLVWPHGIIGHLGEAFRSFTAFTALTLKFHLTKLRL
jgi:hypothetical protein